MKRSYSQDVREQVMREVEDTGDLPAVALKHAIPVGTIHHWLSKRKNAGKLAKERDFKALKRELADKDLEVQILRELLKKTYQVWDKS